MLVNSRKIIKLLEDRFPLSVAAEWDNVGFQVGNINSAVNKVLIALEVTPQVIEEAMDTNADLIICHHPLIFKPLKTLTEDQPLTAMLRKLTTSRIGVYVAHTNADASPGGTVDALLNVLGLVRFETFGDMTFETSYKLAVYVPLSHFENMKEVLFSSGAGTLDHYRECSFAVDGKETFFPTEGARPSKGSIGSRETLDACKLEVVIPHKKVKAVVQAMLEAHPYEVPAYDLWPLEAPVVRYGVGASALTDSSLTLSEWMSHVKHSLKAPMARMSGDPHAKIRKVAVVPGSGAGFFKEAAQLGCDLLITGDIKYHDAQEAKLLGIHLIDAGHCETELPFVTYLAELLRSEIEEKGYDVRVIDSEVNVNPFSIDF